MGNTCRYSTSVVPCYAVSMSHKEEDAYVPCQRTAQTNLAQDITGRELPTSREAAHLAHEEARHEA